MFISCVPSPPSWRRGNRYEEGPRFAMRDSQCVLRVGPFSSFVYGDYLQIAGAGIFALGADEAVVGELLQNMSRPAGHARNGKDGSEQISGDAEGVIDCG